jgi:hypothetical protein
MTKGVGDMIDEILRMLRAQGVDIPVTAKQTVEVQFRQLHAGERIYICGYPKQQRAVQLAKLTKHTQIQMANATGLTVRGVRRILRGK